MYYKRDMKENQRESYRKITGTQIEFSDQSFLPNSSKVFYTPCSGFGEKEKQYWRSAKSLEELICFLFFFIKK